MDNYQMSDAHYAPQQSQRQQQWPPHLLPPGHNHGPSSFPSPVSPPPSSGGEHSQHYPPFYHQQPQQTQQGQPIAENSMHHMDRGSLSLNLSSLTVASPTNLSPINPPSSSMSPATPISPTTSIHNSFHQHHMQHSPFQFTVPDPPQPPSQSPQNTTSQQASTQNHLAHYDEQGMPTAGTQSHFDRRHTTPTTSRSSSSSTSSTSISVSLPRKRSFTSNAGSNTSTLIEEPMYDDSSMDMGGGYDELGNVTGSGVGYVPPGSSGGGGGGGSPVDGSTSGGEDGLGLGVGGLNSLGMGVPGGLNVLGKPLATNNFVTKLYQMINDPKSSHFIAWTELGTSFVVSNVGEFSRSILGSHFKHNNFSSFVRQLNMYGFHKINRTPRAQRTSTDAQTWEFSHHKFLRGRPDLLDEIKRKALEPDPAIKHRVELPGEVAAQLGAMREENRRVWEQLQQEKRRTEKLVGVVTRLWDVVGKRFPGSIPPFPSDLLESESPNIYITSPTSTTSRFPPPLSMSTSGLHSISSPNSSPTTADFPTHMHPHHSLSRQHSFQHVSFTRGEGATSTPLPPSPTMDLFDDGTGELGRAGTKRQRTSNDNCVVGAGDVSTGGSGASVAGKKLSRARSDSAPLGYGPVGSWQNGGGRPRSGSGIAVVGQRGIPNIGSLSRGGPGGPPLLSITTVTTNTAHNPNSPGPR